MQSQHGEGSDFGCNPSLSPCPVVGTKGGAESLRSSLFLKRNRSGSGTSVCAGHCMVSAAGHGASDVGQVQDMLRVHSSVLFVPSRATQCMESTAWWLECTRAWGADNSQQPGTGPLPVMRTLTAARCEVQCKGHSPRWTCTWRLWIEYVR